MNCRNECGKDDLLLVEKYVTEDDRRSFVAFLADLTKDQAYIELTYMTGILPIGKYSSGSSINNFMEYTMVAQSKFGEYFGFTDEEVELLLERYRSEKAVHDQTDAVITKEQLEYWYDGYLTAAGKRIYNPRSVVMALENDKLASYWTASGPYSEVSEYIVNDIDEIRKDIALMVSGERIKVNIEEYAVSAMHLHTREEIVSAMVVYGFLNYDEVRKTVGIPNKELREEFAKTIRKEKSLGYIYSLAKASEEILEATLRGEERTVEKQLEFVHNTETPILSYNNETELAAVVNLAYLAARDRYRVEREDKAGKGYVDFIFYPNDPHDYGLILELKVDETPEAAIRQIRERDYALRFRSRIGEQKQSAAKVLLVGISYQTGENSEKKVHCCKIEEL